MAWSSKKNNGPQWPENDDGEPIPPAFLVRIHGGPLDTELTLNLLEAYGIAYVCEYPNNGLFGKLILGFSSAGIEVFVPETLLEDAQNILSADTFEVDTFENESGDNNDDDYDNTYGDDDNRIDDYSDDDNDDNYDSDDGD